MLLVNTDPVEKIEKGPTVTKVLAGQEPPDLLALICQWLVVGELSTGHGPSYERADGAAGEAMQAVLSAGQGLDSRQWAALVRLAKTEGVAPLLYAALARQGAPVGGNPGVPAQAWTELTQAYYASAAQNALFLQEGERVLEALKQAGIPALVIKGLALAQGVYPDPALRPMGDLDILVRQVDREAALAQAAALGYVPLEPEIRPGLDEQTMHTVFLVGGPGKRVGLELHWSLLAAAADERSAPDAWLWQGAVPFGQVLQPETGAHLLYLAAHQGLRHPDQLRLIWLYDLHRLITAAGETLDWAGVLRQARALGWEGLLAEVLREVVRCFGTAVPPAVWEELPAEGAVALGRQPALPTRTAQTWVSLRRLRPWARLQALWALAFPSGEYLRWRYPQLVRWPLLALYPYRWGIILQDVWKTLLGRV